jgi:hypothetical protein
VGILRKVKNRAERKRARRGKTENDDLAYTIWLSFDFRSHFHSKTLRYNGISGIDTKEYLIATLCLGGSALIHGYVLKLQTRRNGKNLELKKSGNNATRDA